MSQHILITGSTDGIGKLAAISLAKEGHHIYLHGRNEAKLQAVIAEVATHTSPEKVGGFVADFSDLEAVSLMADKILTELSSLDVLINNAGIFVSKQATNDQGMDIRMVVNYLAPVLLTEKLLPLLSASASPRLINLGSAAQASVSHSVLKGEATGSERETYAQSKLAITMWSFYMAETHSDITTIAVNPGSLLNTNMVKEAFGHHWSPADKGGNILYELALEEKHLSQSGKYFDNDLGGYGRAHADAYDPGKIQELIELTTELIKR